jgi:rhodanese-related sulfurtransferase
MTVAAPTAARTKLVGLSAAQLEAHLLAGSAKVVDVRDSAAIADSGHVPGASHWPSIELAPDLEGFTVVYGVTEDDSRRAAESLTSVSSGDIAYLAGGFAAWRDAEMAIAGLAPWHAHHIPTITLTESRTS